MSLSLHLQSLIFPFGLSVCPSALLGCWSWGSLLVLVVLRLSWVEGQDPCQEGLAAALLPTVGYQSRTTSTALAAARCQLQLLNKYNW